MAWSDELQSSLNPNTIEFGSSRVNALMEDYAFTAPGTTATVSITGLEPDVEYRLYLYGVPDGATQDTTFEVFDSTEGIQTVLAGATGDDNGLADPEDYVVFTGLTSSNGEIGYTQTGTSFSGCNGFQLFLIGNRDPLVLEIDQNESGLELSWNSRPGVSYDLVSSPSLDTEPSIWQPVAGQEGIPADESGVNTVVIPRPLDEKRFYAIVELR